MACDRDAIFQALLARLRGIPDLAEVDDRSVHWSQADASNTPALYMVKGTESAIQERGMPPKWSLSVRLYLYTHSANRLNMSAQRQLNMLLTRIEKALEVQPGEDSPWATTLGGLVSHAWIDGPIEGDEGTLGDVGVAVIPLSMLATG